MNARTTRSSLPGADELAADDISNESLERILRWIALIAGVALLAVLSVGIGRWVEAGDERPTPLGAVDVGFMRDMIVHHRQALLIANTYLDSNPNGDARPYATEVVLFQTQEIERMQKMLTGAGYDEGDPSRRAMRWMAMDVPLEQMPGMQTDGTIDELRLAAADRADLLFFEIMSDHHEGGAHMAGFAGENASREDVREFATKMSRNQRIEIVEYRLAVERLGLG